MNIVTISKSDLDDVRVICLMSFISGTPRLCDQNLDDKIKEASLTVQERDAVRAARHGRLRKEAEDHSGSMSSSPLSSPSSLTSLSLLQCVGLLS